MDGSLWRAAPPTQITALQSAPGEISSHHRGVDMGTVPSRLLGIEEAGEFYVERGEIWNILTFSAKITGNLWMGWCGRAGWGTKGWGHGESGAPPAPEGCCRASCTPRSGPRRRSRHAATVVRQEEAEGSRKAADWWPVLPSGAAH